MKFRIKQWSLKWMMMYLWFRQVYFYLTSQILVYSSGWANWGKSLSYTLHCHAFYSLNGIWTSNLMSCFQWIIQVIIHTLNYKDDSLVKGLNCCLLAVANCLFVLRETTMAESANWLFLVLRASRRWCSHIKQSGGIFCPRQPISSFSGHRAYTISTASDWLSV